MHFSGSLAVAQERSPKKMATIAKPVIKTKPVRVDLAPAVHKALKRAAADKDKSKAGLVRRIISEHFGFKDQNGGK
jgi:hypothetical protein